MSGDERLLRDLQRQNFADTSAAYIDALALVTAFVQADGHPTQQQLDEVIRHYDRQGKITLVASCRLAWQILTGLAASIGVINGQEMSTPEVWRLMLEHRAAHGWSDKTELFPFPAAWPT